MIIGVGGDFLYFGSESCRGRVVKGEPNPGSPMNFQPGETPKHLTLFFWGSAFLRGLRVLFLPSFFSK